jgi:predicted RNase H-like nuclease (RuvC/YqgF family)
MPSQPETPEQHPPGETSQPENWRVPSWKRIGEFVANMLQLERSIESLKEDNKRLRGEVNSLQALVQRQQGQLETLLTFVETALQDRMKSHAERAAIRAVEVMLAFRDLPPPGSESQKP